MSGFDLEGFLPYQLAVAASRVSKAFALEYQKTFDITVAEWRVMAHLSQTGPVSVREICDKVDMDKPKVSRAATNLEARGYILKRINPSDRRLVELSLTKRGQAMIDTIAPMATSFEQSLLDSLGHDADAFIQSLGRVADDAASRLDTTS